MFRYFANAMKDKNLYSNLSSVDFDQLSRNLGLQRKLYKNEMYSAHRTYATDDYGGTLRLCQSYLQPSRYKSTATPEQAADLLLQAKHFYLQHQDSALGTEPLMNPLNEWQQELFDKF